MKNQQNELLNAVKGIACIAVVFMHCEFPGLLGTIVQTLSRFCVPFFFMISGYYCFYSNGIDVSDKLNHKIKHIGKITLNATIFYLIIASIYKRGCYIDLKGGVNWLLFNQPYLIAGQLWFLFALLYDYLLFAIVNKTKAQHITLRVTPLLFMVYIFLAQGMHLAGHHVPNMIYRNWLIEGFAFFMTGYWIHKNQDRLRFNNTWLIVVFIFSTLLCLPERYLLGRDFGVNICTIPQVISLFLLATNNPTENESIFSILGRRYSMYVYILHPFIWHSTEKIYERLTWDKYMVALYLMPILVVIGTFLFSHFVYEVNGRLLQKSAR